MGCGIRETINGCFDYNLHCDTDGNTTTKSEGNEFWRYVWDGEDRLASASTRRQTVRYVYDALGRRVRRHFAGSKENTKYTYDGQDVLLDDDSGTLTKYQNGTGIDNKLRSTTGSTANYFLSDHLGSTNGVTNSSGSLTASNSYDSFGIPSNAAFPSRYQFTGREFDNFSGLQYSRARFYDPKLGRFISEDPIGFRGGDVNLYGYVGNHPTMYRDPSGKIIPFVVAGAVAVVVLILTSPSYVNAPGPGDPVYREENPVILNGAVGAACGVALKTFIGPILGKAFRGAFPKRVPNSPSLPSLDALSEAASVGDRGGLTAAGRSLTKHGVGARPDNTLFPPARGNPTAINNTAQGIVDDILNSPDSIFQSSYRPRFGPTFEVTASDGRGLVFDITGKFLFFTE